MDRKDKQVRKGGSSSRTSSAFSMAALAAAAVVGEGADAAGAGGSGVVAPTPMEEDHQTPELPQPAAAAGASSSSGPARRGRAIAAAGGGGGGGLFCQVERCGAEISVAGRYHRRHKVCLAHSRAPVVLIAGLRQRFCQQCSRFHELSEFDDVKKSCRLRLAGHNERRRKSSQDAHRNGGCRDPADPDGRGHPGNPPPLIR